MQSTEEYLDQLLASVSGEETESTQQVAEEQLKENTEELNETELTEDALQDQLAMLLGLEPEKDETPEDDIAALFATMNEEPEKEEAVITREPEPVVQVPDSGILSQEEIAALFAGMGDEPVKAEEDIPAVIEEQPLEESIIAEPAAPDMSGNKMLSPEEIAALFATMGADENVSEMREETDGNITDPAVENEQNAETDVEEAFNTFAELKATENDIQEIPDFNLDEEALLDLENVDALLEATAKQAEDTGNNEDLLSMEEKMEEDIFSMLAQFEEESIQETMAQAKQEEENIEDIMSFNDEDGMPQELLEDLSEGNTKSKKKKKEKVKKEKVKKEKVKKEKPEKKKVSLKEKFMAFAFDDDETEENDDEKTESVAGGKESKKKKKEKAGKKEKKVDKTKAQDENAAIEAELAEEDKKKKQKKEKPVKEKKVKPPKKEKTPEELEAERKEERHSIKSGGIVATLLVCASVLGLILVGTYFVPKYLSLQKARLAFYAGDYEEVALRMEGRSLNESDKLMYEKANLLYGLQERYHRYEIYTKRQMPKEALNALLQGLAACKEEALLAEQLGIVTEWKIIKEQFEDALFKQYGLDAELADEISELRNPAYTIAVENIMAGKAFDDMSAYGGTVKEEPVEENETSEEEKEPELEDLLPEEEAFLEQLQQENHTDAGENANAGQTNESGAETKELYSGTINGGSVNFVE